MISSSEFNSSTEGYSTHDHIIQDGITNLLDEDNNKIPIEILESIIYRI